MSVDIKRRTTIRNILTGSAVLASGVGLSAFRQELVSGYEPLKGNIHHSVCRWCFNDTPLEQLCAAVKDMGLVGIDLVGPADWPLLKKYNLISTMCNGAEISLTQGWADKQYHAKLIDNYTKHIELVAAAGYTNLICFSGNRNGMDDETGWKNCAEGLKQIMSLAEKKGVTIQMELLNSRVDHKDYMCDRTAWGVELCKRVGSPNFKLLYDIYHMQIDEGDVIRTIRNNHQYIGHYHTAGVPGRHEIDESQELFYPAIMKAIVATGFKQYVAQEFIPAAADKLGSLRKAISICDV
ncbi:MAG: TIM barrel protein [Chitinophagaceae bacterium]|jgi:hydroxypyruvate isomerase|nr:TIM barrel protein [Chitinophagaceae bacterium]